MLVTLSLGALSLIIHSLVIWYALKMYRMIRPVRYWTIAWLMFATGNSIIFIRRCIGLYLLKGAIVPGMVIVWPVAIEMLLQIVVSITFLIGATQLNAMYSKYFKNGFKVLSWKEEKTANDKKNGGKKRNARVGR
jgi:hypothetical protein